jgi:ribonuclease G
MSEEILINVTPQETRIAIVENGVLQEIWIERSRKRGLVGNIYKGRVSRVMPGMDAAFVDIGLEKAAFLHASDVGVVVEEMAEDGIATRRETIGQLLREGQQLLVQVVKDQLGTKGARLTTYLTIPSRYLVSAPSGVVTGISSKIEDEDERLRLKRIVERLVAESGRPCGYIVRTAADGATEEALARDIQFLEKLWATISERAERAAPGSAVYADGAAHFAGHGGLRGGESTHRFARNVPEGQRIHRDPDAGDGRKGRALSRRAPDFRPLRHRRRDTEGAGAQGATEIRRLSDHRSD